MIVQSFLMSWRPVSWWTTSVLWGKGTSASSPGQIMALSIVSAHTHTKSWLQSPRTPCTTHSSYNIVTLISRSACLLQIQMLPYRLQNDPNLVGSSYLFEGSQNTEPPYGNNLYFPLAAYVACLMKRILRTYFKYVIELQHWQLLWLSKICDAF